eukprot:CAMPEP_0201545048 /NCGR_PEP_ID=MMETSP0173_2-20130828/1619_1 /ASSEMBLY_ACC=CAM_ASM_000268 /TAXON_ID=218659 /ORGANISM="Vexillifera sp., Strain DIVA3 564/2" /LENGTH=462 /DNA_ID=CAMNT_0047953355 /DNA_START=61 /DNA_END=1449 /DNA_ORIENTATION=-
MNKLIVVCLIIVYGVMFCLGENVLEKNITKIVNAALSDNIAIDRLEYMCNVYGPRFAGTQNLKIAQQWIESQMINDRLDNVRKEFTFVPHWVRGDAKLTMVQPTRANLPLLALGGSVSTPVGGITGEVLVVSNFEELKEQASIAKGKIIVMNAPFTTYGQTSKYRREGASEASKVGAAAYLVRSVTPFSLQSPHTGSQTYQDGVVPIPTAAITIEAAERLAYLQNTAGVNPILELELYAKSLPDVESYNILAEVEGWQHPEQIVVIGGHIDSWDVGCGAQDDGGGSLISWHTLTLLKNLGIQPRRTIRAVMFTNEEFGNSGGKQYLKDHLHELNNTIMAIESDQGMGTPLGLGFTGSDDAFDNLSDLATLIESIVNTPLTITKGGGGVDIDPMIKEGVPGAGLNNAGFVSGTGDPVDYYFWLHHTEADTFDKIVPIQFKQSFATLAAFAYAIADQEQILSRD